jgi:hypothetical protein
MRITGAIRTESGPSAGTGTGRNPDTPNRGLLSRC